MLTVAVRSTAWLVNPAVHVKVYVATSLELPLHQALCTGRVVSNRTST